eukprot:gene21108-biopygen4128
MAAQTAAMAAAAAAAAGAYGTFLVVEATGRLKQVIYSKLSSGLILSLELGRPMASTRAPAQATDSEKKQGNAVPQAGNRGKWGERGAQAPHGLCEEQNKDRAQINEKRRRMHHNMKRCAEGASGSVETRCRGSHCVRRPGWPGPAGPAGPAGPPGPAGGGPAPPPGIFGGRARVASPAGPVRGAHAACLVYWEPHAPGLQSLRSSGIGDLCPTERSRFWPQFGNALATLNPLAPGNQRWPRRFTV